MLYCLVDLGMSTKEGKFPKLNLWFTMTGSQTDPVFLLAKNKENGQTKF